MFELDDATYSCGATAQAEPTRCLIQQQPARAQQLLAGEVQEADAEGTGTLGDLLAAGQDASSRSEIDEMLEEIMKGEASTADNTQTTVLSEKKGDWTGEKVTVEFGATSPDMENVQPLTFTDYYSSMDKTLALQSNVTKTYYEMSFPSADGNQVVSNSTADKIFFYGFTPGTTGLVNSNANSIWFRNPSKPKSKLVMAFRMTAVPGNSEWEYDVEFTVPQPGALTLFPAGGKVAQRHDELYVVMSCMDELECGDGKVIVSAVTFTPKDKKDKDAMKKPEEVR